MMPMTYSKCSTHAHPTLTLKNTPHTHTPDTNLKNTLNTPDANLKNKHSTDTHLTAT